MLSDVLEQFLELDETKKTKDWANNLLSLIRRDARPLISKSEYESLKKIFFGKISDEDLNKIFKSKEMQNVKDKLSKSTLFFNERIRNSLIDDRTASGLRVTVNSLDPEKEDKKTADKELLINRKGIEAILSEITSNNGMPPITVGGDDFNGNVEEFDKEGYNEFNKEQMDVFFDTKWGLKQEFILQPALDAVVKTNKINRNLDKYINDILFCLINVSQVFVDELEGKIAIKYLKPYEVQIYGDTSSNDCKDANAILVEKKSNIRGILRRFGNSINLDRDWESLLHAVNYHAKTGDTPYTGIGTLGEAINYGEVGNLISVTDFLDSMIGYGECEFKTFNCKNTYTKISENGNKVFANPETDAMENGFSKDSKYKEDTIKVIYLMTGETNQEIIKWGKVFMMPMEGFNDEYSGFSYLVTRREGISASEMIKPYWEIAQRSFQMFEMLVNDVKPDGYLYVYESLTKVAEYLQKSTDAPTDIRNNIEALLSMYQDSPNRITTIPMDDEDNIVGGGAFGTQKLDNGLNKTAIELMKILDWCEQKVTTYLATQGIEIAEPRDGFKLSIENKRRTRAATAYIDNILLTHLEDISITSINYILDVSHFKNTQAYKYLKTLVGEKTIKSISELEKSPHRYGTFIDSFNNDVDLMEIHEIARLSYINKEISMEQYLYIRSFDSPKQARYYLIKEKNIAEQKRQESLLSQQEAELRKLGREHELKMALEDKKGEWMRLSRREEAKGFSDAAYYNAQSALAREHLKQGGLNSREAQKSTTAIEKTQKEIELKSEMGM